jgi:uncharacterized protein YjdB
MTGVTIGNQVTKIGMSALPANNSSFVVYCQYNSYAWNYAVENSIAHSDPARVEPTAAAIQGETHTMRRGETQQLTLTLEPQNASDTAVTWYADSNILMVADGTVSALSSGTATVYAELENGVKAAYEIEVAVPVLSITDEQLDYELAVGHDITLAPILLPAAAVERELIWTSDNESVATVDTYGTVTGVNQGEAQITAITESGLSLTYNFSVVIRLEGVDLSAENIYLVAGQRVRFGRIQAIPAQANITEFTFSVDAGNVVSVDETGCIQALTAGEAVITVAIPDHEELTASCHVTVLENANILRLPGALREIEEEAFTGTASKAIVIPEGTVSIGKRAFADSVALKQVSLPSTLTAISNDAFAGASVTVVCPSGSEAERYAADHGFAYMNGCD